MIKKKCLPCSKTVALKLNYFYWKQKVINLLAGTITFLLYWHLFQAYILLHRKLQWGQSRLHNSKLSYVKPPFWNNGTIHHLYRLGLYSQIGEQPSYRFLVSTSIILYIQRYILSNIKKTPTKVSFIVWYYSSIFCTRNIRSIKHYISTIIILAVITISLFIIL